MTFDNNEYWKHDDCTDAFFKIVSVAFDDDDAHTRLYGHWMIQGIHNYWCASEMQPISIKPKDYDKWKPYEPKGKWRY